MDIMENLQKLVGSAYLALAQVVHAIQLREDALYVCKYN